MFTSGYISYQLSFLAFPKTGQVYTAIHSHVTIYTVNGEETDIACSDAAEESHFGHRSCVRSNPIANKISEFGIHIHVHEITDAPHEEMLIQQGNDLSVAIQVELLGNEYVILNHCPMKSNCQVSITPRRDMALVEIVVPFEIQVNVTCKESSDIRQIKAMVPISFNLSRYETLLLETDRDLSGVRVKADKNVSVVAGSHVDEQYFIEMLQPVNSWGVEYIVFLINSEKDSMKIVTAFDDTVLEINNMDPIVLSKAGFKYSRPMTSPHYHIKANKPIGVLYISPDMGTMVQIPPLYATRTSLQTVFYRSSAPLETIIAGVWTNCADSLDLTQTTFINVTPNVTLWAGAVRMNAISETGTECEVVSGVKFFRNCSHYLESSWNVTNKFAVCKKVEKH